MCTFDIGSPETLRMDESSLSLGFRLSSPHSVLLSLLVEVTAGGDIFFGAYLMVKSHFNIYLSASIFICNDLTTQTIRCLLPRRVD